MRYTFDDDSIAALSEDREDPFALFSQGPDDARGQIADALSGRYDSMRQGFIEHLRARRADGIDEITARLLSHMGIDPLAMAVALSITKDDGLHVMDADAHEEDDSLVYMKDEHNHRQAEIMLSPDVTWCATETLKIRNMPETTAIAANGRPLQDLVSHPVLNAYGYRIEDIRSARLNGMDCHQVILPMRTHVRLTLEQLALHRPACLKEAA